MKVIKMNQRKKENKKMNEITRVLNILAHQPPRRSSCLLTMLVFEPAPNKQGLGYEHQTTLLEADNYKV
jgi:hypothetical protein